MIILQPFRPRVLMDVHYGEWRSPSQSVPLDEVGNPTRQTRFRLTARLHDGHMVWRGWMDDRDDADAMLWAIATGTLGQQPALWRLPSPMWPGLDADVAYDFATVTFITSTSGSNQTHTIPSDWNSANNSIEVIASGAGACSRSAGGGYGGSAGGAYSKSANVSLTGGGSATFFLNSGGAGQAAGASIGNNGPDAWYNGTTLAGSSVGAKGGTGCNDKAGSTGGQQSGNTGGVGGTLNKGGRCNINEFWWRRRRGGRPQWRRRRRGY